MAHSAICVANVHYAYPSAIPEAPPTAALRGIEMVVESGEFLAVMGPTGAGKTTLCLALNGLVPQATGGTFRGDVLVAGHNTKRVPVAELATEVGVVFQDSESQLFTMTVEDEVAFGPESLGLSVEEIERRIQWALDVVGLADMRTRSPGHLSGGQQRRLAIAAILAMMPAILVLDEPTGGLDPLGRHAVLDVVAELQQKGTTVVMASQDADAVASLAGRVVVIEAGQVALEGRAQDVLGRVEELHAFGLDAPQMAELSRSLGIDPPCLTVDQAFRALSENRVDRPRHRAPIPAPAGPRTKARPNAAVASSASGLCRVASSSRDPYGRIVHSIDAAPAVPSAIPALDSADVTFEGVQYRYEAGALALAGIDLTIPRGEYVALIGANGSGKTTLAKHVNGLLRPQQGRVLVAGTDTREKSTGELARSVSYLFQNPDHQIFAPSVREELAFGPRNLGLGQEEVERRVEEALAAFHLTPLADLPPATLGYGQRRLVTLASVHAMEPQILILDEPAVGLDRHLTARLVAWVSELYNAGATILLITHDMRLASLAPRSVVMNHGRIVLDAKTPEVFEYTELLTQAGIVAPPIVELSRRFGLPSIPLNIDGFCQTFAQSAGEVSIS